MAEKLCQPGAFGGHAADPMELAAKARKYSAMKGEDGFLEGIADIPNIAETGNSQIFSTAGNTPSPVYDPAKDKGRLQITVVPPRRNSSRDENMHLTDYNESDAVGTGGEDDDFANKSMGRAAAFEDNGNGNDLVIGGVVIPSARLESAHFTLLDELVSDAALAEDIPVVQAPVKMAEEVPPMPTVTPDPGKRWMYDNMTKAWTLVPEPAPTVAAKQPSGVAELIEVISSLRAEVTSLRNQINGEKVSQMQKQSEEPVWYPVDQASIQSEMSRSPKEIGRTQILFQQAMSNPATAVEFGGDLPTGQPTHRMMFKDGGWMWDKKPTVAVLGKSGIEDFKVADPVMVEGDPAVVVEIDVVDPVVPRINVSFDSGATGWFSPDRVHKREGVATAAMSAGPMNKVFPGVTYKTYPISVIDVKEAIAEVPAADSGADLFFDKENYEKDIDALVKDIYKRSSKVVVAIEQDPKKILLTEENLENLEGSRVELAGMTGSATCELLTFTASAVTGEIRSVTFRYPNIDDSDENVYIEPGDKTLFDIGVVKILGKGRRASKVASEVNELSKEEQPQLTTIPSEENFSSILGKVSELFLLGMKKADIYAKLGKIASVDLAIELIEATEGSDSALQNPSTGQSPIVSGPSEQKTAALNNVFNEFGKRLTVVLSPDKGKFRLVDKEGNVYENGTRKEIEDLIDKMIAENKWSKKEASLSDVDKTAGIISEILSVGRRLRAADPSLTEEQIIKKLVSQFGPTAKTIWEGAKHAMDTRAPDARHIMEPAMAAAVDVTAPFGTIEWQNQMAAEIARKTAVGEPLTDYEETFIEVQTEVNNPTKKSEIIKKIDTADPVSPNVSEIEEVNLDGGPSSKEMKNDYVTTHDSGYPKGAARVVAREESNDPYFLATMGSGGLVMESKPFMSTLAEFEVVANFKEGDHILHNSNPGLEGEVITVTLRPDGAAVIAANFPTGPITDDAINFELVELSSQPTENGLMNKQMSKKAGALPDNALRLKRDLGKLKKGDLVFYFLDSKLKESGQFGGLLDRVSDGLKESFVVDTEAELNEIL